MAYHGSNNPSRLGFDATGSAGNEDLFLKVFSGEVLTTFQENNVMMPLTRSRTITSGKSAQFPVTGVAGAKYHTPGESLFADEQDAGDPLYLSKMNHAERVISIDGVLTSSAFIADIDEAKNHYEVRSIYSTEIGRQLAYTADKALVRTVIAGARKIRGRFATADNANQLAQESDLYVGNQICIDGTATGVQSASQGAASDTHGVDLFNGIFKAVELMDQKNVPGEGRVCVLSPADYYTLLKENKDAISRDYNPGNNGSLSGGEIVSVAGVLIVKSNHIPAGNEDNGGGGTLDTVLGSDSINNNVFANSDGYSGIDFRKTRGIIFQTEAVGTVKLMDLAMESEYKMERLGTLMMARYAMGHGILREEACYEMVDNT